MTYEDFLELQEKTFEKVRALRETKGREYAHDADTLADFKEVAEAAGVTPLQCWLVYVEKHQRAIATAVREGGRVKSESLEDRITDVIVYHLLLLGLIQDELHHEQTRPADPEYPSLEKGPQLSRDRQTETVHQAAQRLERSISGDAA
jgi:hypothetical protein